MSDYRNTKEHLITYSDTCSRETVEEVHGAWFKDSLGKSYLNLNDISCILGYSHPLFTKRMVEAAKNRSLGHFGILSDEKEKMIAHFMEVTNGDFDKIFIASSGGEVVDWSLKLARRATGKDKIFSYDRSLHGRSFAGAFISGLPTRKEGFGSGLQNVCFLDGVNERNEEADSKKLKDAAAIIIEPFQAANAMASPNLKYWKWLRDFTRENNIVLILDEIQTGFGKTGTFFAYEKLGIVPDILLAGKGMSNGFGLGAMLVSKEVAQTVKPFELSGGSADNDFMCSMVNAVFEILEKENILNNVKEMGELLRNKMSESLKSLGFNAQFKGDGLFMTLKFEEGMPSKIAEMMKEDGIIIGKNAEHLMVRSPLILNKEEVEFVASSFDRALRKTAE